MNSNNENINLIDTLVKLFCLIDDIIKVIEQQYGKARITKKKNCGAKPKLSSSEIVTIAIYRYIMRYKEWKRYHAFLLTHHKKEFPNLPNYSNFIIQIHNAQPYAMIVLLILLESNKIKTSDVKSVDSTSLPVCNIKRASSHKVCKDYAQKAKTTKGWFYGFKLHLVVDMAGNILSFRITAGNVDDRKPLENLLKKLHGIILADAGYISKELFERLNGKGILFLYPTRKNMKTLMTKDQHNILKKRQIVEIVFGVMKENMGLETWLPRSLKGHFSHYIYLLLSYTIEKMKDRLLLAI